MEDAVGISVFVLLALDERKKRHERTIDDGKDKVISITTKTGSYTSSVTLNQSLADNISKTLSLSGYSNIFAFQITITRVILGVVIKDTEDHLRVYQRQGFFDV